MKILILNASPRKKGTVVSILKRISDVISQKHEVEWIDVYDLKLKPCIACMKCRTKGECVLPEDDAHIAGRRIKSSDGLIIGTPTHWGNMSAQLKLLFDRNVPVFMGETSRGLPIPHQKGKSAAIVAACSTPWPFNFILAESRGAIRSVREVLHYGGYKIKGKIAVPGTRGKSRISRKILGKAKNLGLRF